MTTTSDILFNDLLALEDATQLNFQECASVNNDCDCVAHGSTINRIQIDPQEITWVATEKN